MGKEFLEDTILPNTLAIEEMSGIGSSIYWKPPYYSKLWGCRELTLTIDNPLSFSMNWNKGSDLTCE